MPINPEIILAAGKAIPNLAAPDPLEQYGKALTLRHLLQQGELADLKTQETRQSLAEQQGVRDVFSRAAPGSTLEALIPEIMRASPKTGIEYQGKLADQQAKRATIAHTTAQTEDLNAGRLAGAWAALAKGNGSDESVRAVHQMMAPYVGEDRALEVTNQLLALPPEQRLASAVAHAAGHKVGQEALKILFPAAHMQDTGGSVVPVSTSTLPGSAPGSVVSGATPIVKTATPDAVMTDKRTREEGALSRGVTMRGQNMTDARARELASIQREQGRIPPGYRMGDDGSLVAIPGGPADMGKTLPNPAVQSLAGAGQSVEDTRRLSGSFKPEYGGKTILGDMSNTIGRVFGDPSGQAQWWQDMDTLQNQTRHALFGSALTSTELAAWNKTSITPRMSPDEIKENLARRQEVEARAASKLARSYESAGYNKQQIRELLGTAAEYIDKPAPTVAPVRDRRSAGWSAREIK